MRFFFKKRDPLEEFDQVNLEKEILEYRKKTSNKTNTYYLLFFVCTCVSILYFFQITLLNVITLLLFVILSIICIIWRNNKLESSLQDNKFKHEEVINEVINDDTYNSIEKFLNHFNETEEQEKIRNYRYENSFFINIFNRLVKAHSHNPHALVCPHCNSNNGLSDAPETTEYICPSCKKHVRNRMIINDTKQKSD